MTGSCLYHSILIACQEALLLLYQPGKRGDFTACGRLCLGAAALRVQPPSTETGWSHPGLHGCAASPVQAAGPPPSCCSHIWKAEEAACVGGPSGQSCALQLVHLPMESTISCPREESSPSLVQNSAEQNRGCSDGMLCPSC